MFLFAWDENQSPFRPKKVKKDKYFKIGKEDEENYFEHNVSFNSVVTIFKLNACSKDKFNKFLPFGYLLFFVMSHSSYLTKIVKKGSY